MSEKMDKRFLKKEGEELQSFLQFRNRGYFIKSKKGKGLRKEIILFNLKQEEYIMWLYNKLKEQTYKHGGYAVFYIKTAKNLSIYTNKAKKGKGKRRTRLLFFIFIFLFFQLSLLFFSLFSQFFSLFLFLFI